MNVGLFDNIINATEASEQTKLASGDDGKAELKVTEDQLEFAVTEILAGISAKKYCSHNPVPLNEMAYNVLVSKGFSLIDLTMYGDETSLYVITWGKIGA